MKISLNCNSLLLNATLQSYLGSCIVSYDECDFVISDRLEDFSKPICLVDFSPNSKVQRPFSRDSLRNDLNLFFNEIQPLLLSREDKLNREIDDILREFSSKIIEVIKKYNAN